MKCIQKWAERDIYVGKVDAKDYLYKWYDKH